MTEAWYAGLVDKRRGPRLRMELPPGATVYFRPEDPFFEAPPSWIEIDSLGVFPFARYRDLAREMAETLYREAMSADPLLTRGPGGCDLVNAIQKRLVYGLDRRARELAGLEFAANQLGEGTLRVRSAETRPADRRWLQIPPGVTLCWERRDPGRAWLLARVAARAARLLRPLLRTGLRQRGAPLPRGEVVAIVGALHRESWMDPALDPVADRGVLMLLIGEGERLAYLEEHYRSRKGYAVARLPAAPLLSALGIAAARLARTARSALLLPRARARSVLAAAAEGMECALEALPYERAFRQIRPRLCLMNGEKDPELQSAAAAAKRHGSQTVSFMCGEVYGLMPHCHFIDFDAVAVWGEFHRRVFSEVYAIPLTRLALTGRPAPPAPATASGAVETAEGKRPVVLCCLGTVDSGHASAYQKRREVDGYLLCARQYPEVHFAIKDHPSARDRILEQAVEGLAARLDNLSVLPPDETIGPFIAVAVIVVSFISTSLLEALLAGKDAIIFNLGWPEGAVTYAREGAALEVRTAEELCAAVGRILGDEATRRRLAEGRVSAVRHHLDPTRNRFAERFPLLLRQLLEGKGSADEAGRK